MIKAIKYGADIINDVSGFTMIRSLKNTKEYNLQKFFTICKAHPIQCKKIQNIRMFY